MVVTLVRLKVKHNSFGLSITNFVQTIALLLRRGFALNEFVILCVNYVHILYLGISVGCVASE